MTIEADVRTSFANAVRWWRKKHGITQEQLAERADLHRTYISDVERGARNLSLESISKLAIALEVSVATLFGAAHLQSEKATAVDGQFVEILMVEDSPEDVDLALRAFKQARFANRIHVVPDGMEALDFLFGRGQFAQRSGAAAPHMILLDLSLPRLGGLELLRRLKANPSTESIPVVVLTGSSFERDLVECRQLGVKTYINKPVNLQRLCEVTPQLQMDWALYKPPALLRA